jgi:toxin-antitoxin system PIN domain toxin
MVLVDVNVLVYAHHRGAVDHAKYLGWLEEQLASDQAFGMSDLILSGFLRIVTNPRVFDPPSKMTTALAFVDDIRSSPNCVPVAPGPRHWDIFVGLCKAAGVKGNLVPDAYLAALAIEFGCRWISTDRDYSRFPGLAWQHPLTPLA